MWRMLRVMMTKQYLCSVAIELLESSEFNAESGREFNNASRR
jgi:hypothetical protein